MGRRFFNLMGRTEIKITQREEEIGWRTTAVDEVTIAEPCPRLSIDELVANKVVYCKRTRLNKTLLEDVVCKYYAGEWTKERPIRCAWRQQLEEV